MHRFRFVPSVSLPPNCFSTVVGPSRSNYYTVFNRVNENKMLTDFLYSYHPGIMVVTRARDTGKTRLIENIMQKTQASDRLWWFHINMRDMRDPLHQWTSVEAAYRSLLITFTNSFRLHAKSAAKTFLNSLELKLPITRPPECQL